MPTADDAGRAVGDAGKAMTDAGRAAADAVGAAGHAAATSASDAGRAAAGFAADAGHAAGAVVSDAGRLIGSAFDSAGAKLHDLRSAVTPQPKSSGVSRGVTAVAVAAILGALAAGAAFFLDPVRGARRRAAIRRRLGAQAYMARTGVDTAVDVAKRASEKAVEYVRIPIESARDLVGSRNGHSTEGTADTEALVAAGSMAAAGGFGETDAGLSGSSVLDESWSPDESGSGMDDAAASSIYGGSTVITDGGPDGEPSRSREAVGE
jgi:hypothetical protein